MKRIVKKLIPTQVLNMLSEPAPDIYAYRLSTSLSDNGVYPDACMKASIDADLFANFRRNKIYQQILEHVSQAQGSLFLEEIIKTDKSLLDRVEEFRKNDEWGNPEVFEYPNLGLLSPTTLRYIKVLADLVSLFGKLDNMNICEIGVGYGGQCRIINAVAEPAHYTLVDIKPALLLAQRYLDNYVLPTVMEYKTMNELEAKDYDLVISNYSFTELKRDVQDMYLKKVILRSKRGYITYNDINPDSFRSYKKDELLTIIPGSRIIDEKPLTSEKNCIIVWGVKENGA
jgi:hypothetical protein